MSAGCTHVQHIYICIYKLYWDRHSIELCGSTAFWDTVWEVLAELSNPCHLAATPPQQIPFKMPLLWQCWASEVEPTVDFAMTSLFLKHIQHRRDHLPSWHFKQFAPQIPTPVLPLGSPLSSPWGWGWGIWCWGKQALCSSAGIADSKPFSLPSQTRIWQHLLLPSWHGVKAMTVSFQFYAEISVVFLKCRVARSCWGKEVCEPRTKHSKK